MTEQKKVEAETSVSKVNVKDGLSEKKESKNKNKNKKRNVVVQSTLSLLTLGLFSRFCPRNKDKKGSWFITVLIISILFGSLVVERFFKQEFNELAKSQLNVEENIIPEVLPFESEFGTKTQAESKLELANGLISSLTEKNSTLESKLLEEKMNKSSASNEIKDVSKFLIEKDLLLDKAAKGIEGLELKNLELKLKSEAQEVEIADLITSLEKQSSKVPMINFSSLKSASSEVGCNTDFSLERSKDIFNSSYKAHWVEWSGIVKSSNNEHVEIVDKSDKNNVVKVRFEKLGSGYYLEKGQDIVMKFQLEENASCKTPFYGNTGFQIKAG